MVRFRGTPTGKTRLESRLQKKKREEGQLGPVTMELGDMTVQLGAMTVHSLTRAMAMQLGAMTVQRHSHVFSPT